MFLAILETIKQHIINLDDVDKKTVTKILNLINSVDKQEYKRINKGFTTQK